MKIFYALTLFISLAVTGLGCFLIVDSAIHWTSSYFTTARIVLGSLLALLGLSLSVAIVVVIVSDKIKKRRMKKGGRK